jgi:uncharacterized OsmC-like protein
MASKDLNFKINGKSIGHTKYQGYARNFELIVDEPEMLGGDDSAANPVEYLLAGYAGCLNVVFGIVAKELAIEIQSLKINIDGDINPEKFLGISNDERAGFKSLNVGISLITNSDKEKEDLLFKTVRNRCPINDNLSNPTPINYIYN